MNNHPHKIIGKLWPSMARIATGFALLIALTFPILPAQYTPLGYWRFENPNPLADSSGNNHPVNVNPGSLNLQNTAPIAGQYHHAQALPNSPGSDFTLDNGSTNQELSLEFWFRSSPGMRTGRVFWDAKCQLIISDIALQFDVAMANGSLRTLYIPLTGVGLSDPHYLLDQDWHHLVGTFSACTGEMRLYLDGQCPQGFLVHQTASMAIHNGGDLYFTYNGQSDQLVGDLDEIAAYDTVIPPNLVWQHHQQGLAGHGYTFSILPMYAGPLPFPTSTQQGGINLPEFAPGYPTVAKTPVQLFRQYPMPRHSVIDSIMPLIPWMADVQPFLYGTVPNVSNGEAMTVFKTLAREWNFYLFCHNSRLGYQYLNPANNQYGNGTFFMHHVLAAMDDPANLGLPRFMTTNWPQLNARDLDPNRALGSQILRQAMADSFYVQDSVTGVPIPDLFGFRRKKLSMAANPGDARLDSITFDGLVNRFYIEQLMLELDPNERFMDLIGENDEAIGIMNQAYLLRDRDIRLDYQGYSPQNFKVYQSDRITTFRERYQTPWRGYLDSLNALNGRDSLEDYWYNLGGESFTWPLQRTVLNYRDGLHRGGPFAYPQTPARWRHGTGAFHGMDQICQANHYQMQAGDSVFIPAVSPGFNDGGVYNVADVGMIRPGQFLGMLKGMAGIGAESYALFLVQVGNNSQANWRIWQLPMLSYAQGVTSRVQRFFNQGTVLVGDTSFTSFGVPPTYFSFSTGNDNDFITARKSNLQEEYLIYASAQRTNNMPGQGPHRKTVSFRLHGNAGNTLYDPFLIEERLQGSTYLLDNTNPSAPVFHQLDRWHEWKDPSHWCRDFDFEAEVWDSASGPVDMLTERPLGVQPGDFREFTTFSRYQNLTAYEQYHFQPRGADQDSLYLWVRVRNNGAASTLTASIDGGAFQTVDIPAGPGWNWRGRTAANMPILFGPLDTTAHVLEIHLGSTAIDIDQVTLKRSPNDFSGAAFTVTAAAQNVCLGDSTHFTGTVLLPSDCVDLEWEFGDGTRDYVLNPVHLYQYPGTYTVVFSAYHACLDSLVSDTITVQVNAPYVDAGPDRLSCIGGTVSLAGDTLNADSIHWTAHPGLTDTLVLNPGVTVTTSSYCYLTAVDTSSGCAMTDSVWVGVVAPITVTASRNDTICLGQQAQLKVQGAFYVWWGTPTAGLSSTTVWNPVASPSMTTTYHWFAADACRCDTVDGYITITVPGIDSTTVTGCLSGIVTLTANGGTSYLWSPGGQTTASINVLVTGTQTYTVTITSPDCGNVVDQVTVILDNQPPTLVCPNAISVTNSLGACSTAVSYAVSFNDNCPGATLVQMAGLPSGSTFPIGMTNNSFTVTDANGNTTTCSFNVTVTDNENPTISCPASLSVSNSVGACSALVGYIVTSSDNCPGQTTTQTQGLNSNSNFPVGTTTNSFTVTDASGNTATCSFTVTVADSENPTISCPASLSVSNSVGACSALVGYIVTSSDNCPGQTTTQTQGLNPNSNFPVGVTTNSFTVTDASGNTATCSFTVTVADSENPTISCPGSLSVSNSVGACSALVGYIVTSSDNCPGQTTTQTQGLNSNSNFPVGVTTNSFTVTDASGNTATCNFTVTVIDNEAPVAHCQPVAVSLDGLGNGSITVTQVDNLSSDNCGITTMNLSQTTFGCGNVGPNTVVLTVTDASGNTATCSAVVTVVDLVPPVALCQNVTLSLNAAGNGSTTPAAVDNGSSDACGISNVSLSVSAFNCSNLGANTVTLIVRDVNNNASTCTATVTVLDLLPPSAFCHGATVQLDGSGNGTLLPGDVDNGSTDNCPPVALGVSPNTFTCASIGFNTVVLTATDGSGNFSQCTAAVQVVDLVPPVAVCQNVTLALNSSGTGTITPAQVDAGSSDNCGGTLGLIVFPNTFDCDDIQLLPVTVSLTVTDGGGLVSTCLANVTIPVTPTCCNMPGPGSYYNVSASQFGGGISTSIRLNGTFTVDQSITISGASTVIGMGANARIVVMPGKTLTINGATLQAGCGEMWDGIYLGSPTSALVMTGGFLNDALNGIVSDNGAPFTLNGGTFQRNLNALQVRNYTGLLPHPGSVKACKFYDGTLFTPQPGGLNGFAGIRVTDVKGFTIGFPDNSATTENLFQSQTPNVAGGGLQYGILIQNSTVNVYHNRFRDIVPPSSGSGPYTVGTYCGVSSVGADTALILNVGHPTSNNGPMLSRHANTFIGCQQGVFAERPQKVNVRGNTMDRAVRDGVFMRRIHNAMMHIERNTLTDCNSGILVGDSPNVTGTVSSNTITGSSLAFRFGIQLQVLTYPSTVGAGVFPMQVRDNTIDLRGNGMWINASWNVNVEGNTIRVIRGTNTLEAINGIFATSNTLLRIANNPSISSAGAGSTDTLVAGIYVNRSFQTMVLCNTMRNIGRCAVFEGDCEPSDFLGNTMRNGVDGFVVIDGKIGEQGRRPTPGVFPPDGVPVENTWQNMGRSRVLMIAQTGQICIGNDSKFNFRSSSNNQNPSFLGQNLAFGQGVAAMIPQPMSNQNNAHVSCTSMIPGTGTGGVIKNVAQNRLQGNSPHIRATQFRADEWAYTALIRDPNLAVGEPVIQAYQANMTGSSLAATSTANEVLVVPDSLLARQAASQIALLGNSEANHKSLLDSRLQDAQLSPSEISQLTIIAAKCEAEGGKAVNLARGLLACEGIMIWGDPGCAGNAKVTEGKSTSDAKGGSVNVDCWPNPSSGKIFLASTDAVSGTLKVYDTNGKLLLTRQIELDGANMEIDGTAWSQGLLLVSLELKDGTLRSWRVLMQR